LNVSVIIPILKEFFFGILFVYLRERAQAGGEGRREGGKADSLLSREPDAGLDPGPGP